MEYKKPSNLCPRCGSENLKIVDYMEIKCRVCSSCGFDERELYEVYPDERISQKEKGRFSPYKIGGKGRVLK